MNTLAIFAVLVGVASAQFAQQQGVHQAAPQQGHNQGVGVGAGAATGRAGLMGLLPVPKDYGPKVYGQGHKNQWAMPPNPFTIARALQIVNSIPNTLVRLDLDGEVTLTNQYGMEVEPVDAWGREIELEF